MSAPAEAGYRKPVKDPAWSEAKARNTAGKHHHPSKLRFSSPEKFLSI